MGKEEPISAHKPEPRKPWPSSCLQAVAYILLCLLLLLNLGALYSVISTNDAWSRNRELLTADFEVLAARFEASLHNLETNTSVLSAASSPPTMQDVNPVLSFSSIGELQTATLAAFEAPSADILADILQRIELSTFDDFEIGDVETVQSELIVRLQEQVKAETQSHYQTALNAKDYRQGLQQLTEAAGILALYQISDDEHTIREAEALSQRHNEMRLRLESIRRARYNSWAATTIQRALRILREEEDGYLEGSLSQLAMIEPSLLEMSTSSLYGYAIEQLL